MSSSLFHRLFEMDGKLLELSQLPQPCLKCVKHLTSYKRICSMREISLIMDFGKRWEKGKVLACILSCVLLGSFEVLISLIGVKQPSNISLRHYFLSIKSPFFFLKFAVAYKCTSATLVLTVYSLHGICSLFCSLLVLLSCPYVK